MKRNEKISPKNEFNISFSLLCMCMRDVQNNLIVNEKVPYHPTKQSWIFTDTKKMIPDKSMLMNVGDLCLWLKNCT